MGGDHRIVRTVANIAAWVCMGLFSEVSMPTLPYLKQRVSSDYEEIGRTLMARGVGHLLGCLTAGLLFVRWKRLGDTWLGLALIVAGVVTAVAPWCRRLELLGFAFFTDGASKGILVVGTNTLILAMWESKAPVPMNALFFAFGIGALASPQLCRPFLPSHPYPANSTTAHFLPEPRDLLNQSLGSSGDVITSDTTGDVITSDTSLNATENVTAFRRVEGDHIEIVYGIIAAITFALGLCFLVLQVAFKPSSEEVDGDEKKSEKVRCGWVRSMCPNGSRLVKTALLLMLFIYWSLPVGAERAYGKFLFSFSLDSNIHMEVRRATILGTVFWATFTAGRGLATLACHWVAPAPLLMFFLAIKLLSSFLLAALADTNEVALWVCTAAFAASMSPIFPASLLWVNIYVEMDGVMNAFAFVSSAVGAMVFSWLAGYLFEYHGPPYLMYFMVAYAILVSTMFAVLFLYVRIPKVRKSLGKRKLFGDEKEETKIGMGEDTSESRA